MNPVQVLDRQAALIAHLSTPAYVQYMQHYMDDTARKQNGPVIHDPKTGEPSGWHFTRREIQRLEWADAYFVSRDMHQVAVWSAHSLPGTGHFTHDTWPSDRGFLWLDEDLVGKEIWGRVTTTKAISWGRISEGRVRGTLVVFYTDIYDPKSEANVNILANPSTQPEALEEMGNLHVHHLQFIDDGWRVGPASTQVSPDFARFAEMDENGQTRALAPDATNDSRYLLSVLMLMKQTISATTFAEAERKAAKRLRKMKIPDRVTIIDLRRTEAQPRAEGQSLVEWAHCWPVVGHWGWRHCSKDNPDAVEYEKGWHVWTYIRPAIKGNRNGPLIQTQKVRALRR